MMMKARIQKRIVLLCAIAVCLCGVTLESTSAFAQFKHRAIGAVAGFQLTSNPGGDINAAKGSRTERGYGVGPSYFTLGGHGGYHFDERFGLYVQAVAGFHQCSVPNDVCEAGSTPISLSVFTDFRIFFMTDSFRPYFNIGVGYWQLLGFVKTNIASFGPTAALGFEWFLPGVEEIALGLEVRYGLQLVIGEKGLEPFHSLNANFVFTTYF